MYLSLEALEPILHRPVPAAHVDHLALLGRGANAAAVARIRGAAALRLALVILEHEEGIVANLECRTHQRLIRQRIAILAHAVIRHQLHAVKCTHRLIAAARAPRLTQEIACKILSNALTSAI